MVSESLKKSPADGGLCELLPREPLTRNEAKKKKNK